VDTDHATVALAVSSDCGVIAFGGSDGIIRLWDLETRKELRKLAGHEGSIVAVAFSADGRRLVSGGRDTSALIWDVAGVRPSIPGLGLGAEELREQWDALAARDSAAALKAIRRLALASEQALPFISASLSKQQAADPARLASLLADLGSGDVERRDAAAAEFSRLGRFARPTLKRALEGTLSAEFRRRAEALLKEMDDRLAPAELQSIRTLEVLERIATPEARKLIEFLSKDSASPPVAEEAKAVLHRLPRPGDGD
jgi:hypothetical protein